MKPLINDVAYKSQSRAETCRQREWEMCNVCLSVCGCSFPAERLQWCAWHAADEAKLMAADAEVML